MIEQQNFSTSLDGHHKLDVERNGIFEEITTNERFK